MAAQYGPNLSRSAKYRIRMRVNTDPVMLAIADGLLAVAQEIVDTAKVPDAAPLGLGLIQGGGAAAWALGKRVDHNTVKVPRGIKAPKGAMAVAGFEFPGRFVELGTVDTAAQPFLGPAAMAVLTGPKVAQMLAEHFPKLNEKAPA